MLTIVVEGEFYDEDNNRFESLKACTLKLEHSLLSLYKWESTHHVHFLGNENLTNEDIIDYIKCMTVNQVDDKVYRFLSADIINKVNQYIADPMSATTFYDPFAKNGAHAKDIVTSEVIYSSMIILGIPLEFEKRHLNHLITLIKVCNEKQNPDSNKQSKINPREVAVHYHELNQKRKSQMKTKG